MLLFDYTKICPHLIGQVYNKDEDKSGIHAWGDLQ
jgi:hypothetical protein